MYKIVRADERHRKDLNRLMRKYLWSTLTKDEPITNYWIIRDDKCKVVACCGLDFHNGNAILTSLAVEKGFRHQGIGSALVTHRLKIAKQRAAKFVALITMYYHFNFYKKRGFRTCPRADLPTSIKSYSQFTTSRYKKCAVMFRPI